MIDEPQAEFRPLIGSQAYVYVPIADRSERELKEIAEKILAKFAHEHRVRLGPIEMSFEGMNNGNLCVYFVARCIEVAA